MSAVPEEEDLPPYEGITLDDIVLVKTEAEAAQALAALSNADVVGFDTESKPTFTRGEESTGPHLVQLATESKAYLFQVGAKPQPAHVDVLRAVLESPAILKVGFGLGDDLRRLRAKLGIETQNVVDLSTTLRRRGERNTLGAKTAVARFFGQRLAKSKRITTTNWALPRLSEQQIRYAADDAHVALKIYRHWRANPPA
ncbi:3'-5' exonuclease [Massilia litorea]|uniref:3'-5' exonuclease domain-containing protein 2 n=1 Tax=Massilia litorea TaxID=2769491 RepID=A0A7L9U4L8_9BURK|nr:3'-5' exonuclease [Massilia litorea]QOL49359.1 3'-5' exonuclease domain-containing protein 2 [Massilia litorea]